MCTKIHVHVYTKCSTVQVNSAVLYMYSVDAYTIIHVCTVHAQDSCSMSKRTDLSLSDKLGLLKKIRSQPRYLLSERYLRIDKDIQCFNNEDVVEDDIVEAVSSKRICQSEDSSEDEDIGLEEEVVKTTHAAARHSVQLLQRYFFEQGINDAYDAAMDMCADEAYRRANAKMRQTTLDSFTLHQEVR